MSDFCANLSVEALGTLDYGDMVMVNGDLLMTSDAAQKPGYLIGTNPVLQHVLIRLRTFLSEWFLDSSVGVPWFQELLAGASSRPNSVDAVLKSVLLATPGISQLIDWQVSIDSVRRVMTISFKATTVAGYIDYSAPVSIGAGVQAP